MSQTLRCLAVLFLLFVPGLLPARAADPSVITAIRLTSVDEGDDVEIELDGAAQPDLLTLKSPYRLALDLTPRSRRPQRRLRKARIGCGG